ncbi:MAG: hypothetical protein VX777_03190 [Chlamydiota bacterium]|nr:hypothetical protein [Chlamydiota bacterium]
MSETKYHPFYGKDIISRNEHEKVEEILREFKGEPVTEELKKRIWDKLQMAKHQGIITIPFKVVMRRDRYKKYPDRVEVILDTKV